LIAAVSTDGETDQPGGGEGGEGVGELNPDLDKMTRAELDALAAERGVDIAEAKNKGDVIDLLKKAEADPKNKAEPGAPKNK
jgi:hypothetical protein